MGIGLSLEFIHAPEWPKEKIRVRCPVGGEIFEITRYKRFPDIKLPPALAAEETEQICPFDNTPLCGEIGSPSSLNWIKEHKLGLILGAGGILTGLSLAFKKARKK